MGVGKHSPSKGEDLIGSGDGTLARSIQIYNQLGNKRKGTVRNCFVNTLQHHLILL